MSRLFRNHFLRTLVMLLAAASAPEGIGADAVVHRRPVAAVLSPDADRLYVANRRSGSISTVTIASRCVSEQTIGQQLTALVRRPYSAELLALDYAASELIVMQETPGGLRLKRRIETAAWPVGLSVSPDGSRCVAASLWSRRLSLIPLDTPPSAASPQMLDLPFAPRAIEFVDDRHVVVGEAFGGRLAVVNAVRGRLLAVRELPVHNIRDLARDGDTLLLTHQVLNSRARTEAEHIHWGILMQNEVSLLQTAELLNADHDTQLSRHAVAVGQPGNGGGDPEAIWPLPAHLLVTVAGTDELAIIDRQGVREVRVQCGSRPVHLTVDPAGRQACVVNQLSDSVTVVDLITRSVTDEISLGPKPPPGLVERGEQAFFSARLSLEHWMSCHSCHTDGHTNNQLADTLGDGSYGDAKRVPSLLGVWSTGPWAWNGRHHVLHTQIMASLQTTMHTQDYRLTDPSQAESPQASAAAGGTTGMLPEDEVRSVATELAAYLTTLSRPPSIRKARGESADADSETRGAEVFYRHRCSDCHDPYTSMTTDGVFDVGLRDQAGQRLFNPPALNGVSQRDRFFHDGRATSLEEVLIEFAHPDGEPLPRTDRMALLSYLRGL